MKKKSNVSPGYLYQAARVLTALKEYLRAQVEETTATRILDLGCGTGLDLIQLAKAHPSAQLIGIDSDRAMLREAKFAAFAQGLEQRISFYLASASELPLKDGSVDCILSDRVFQHIPKDELDSSFKEVHRVLSLSGTFICSDTLWPDVTLHHQDKVRSEMIVHHYAEEMLTNGAVMQNIEEKASQHGLVVNYEKTFAIEITDGAYVPHLSTSFLDTLSIDKSERDIWLSGFEQSATSGPLCTIPMKVVTFSKG